MTDKPSTIETIYTDGACSGNPGRGGWGTVIYFSDGTVHELGAGEAQTTNNRMELQAAIAALEFLCESGQNQPVTVYTDSEYVQKGITQWIKGWKNKGWKTSSGKPVLNQDLWQTLDRLNSHRVSWEYVRGHSGNIGNERCDAIARTFATGKTPKLHQLSLMEAPVASEDKLGVRDTKTNDYQTIQSNRPVTEKDAMENLVNSTDELQPPREVRVAQLRNVIETLRIAEEIAREGYLISSSELADLMDVNASAVTSRGDHWSWRNWIVSRVRREGNQILWQLERAEG